MVHRNGLPTPQPGDSLGPIEIGVLEAFQESVARKEELLPLLAQAVSVPEDRLFYTWAARRCKQSGRIGDSGWAYFFHGLECNLRHADGRFLRIDFGPKGRLDTFNGWGVLQFIMTSTPPWSEFADLKQHFAEREPPFDEYAGSFSKMCPVSEALEARGVFEPADPELVAFQARYTTTGADGIAYVRLPPDTPDEVHADCSVADRSVLSAVGHRLLEAHAASHSA